MSLKIKIIGDSIAAGQGCSLFQETDEVIMQDNGKQYFLCNSPNSWWGLLEQEGYHVKSMGCCGAFSYQIRKHLNELVAEEDEIVLILMGLNDRKRVNGMNELRSNTEAVVKTLKEEGKKVILLTPIPSAHQNEYLVTRIYHTDEVVAILKESAEKMSVPIIDNYQFVKKYLEEEELNIEDIIYGDGCQNDGLHPGDFAQRLIFENIVNSGFLE